MPEHRLLIVDDDSNLLQSFTRQLRKVIPMDTATSGPAGLEAVQSNGPYSLVISDYNMPGMTGVQFLSKVKELSPDTIRVLLTGYADLEVAIKAVNEGGISRLLTKPCPPEMLIDVIKESFRHWDLIYAEKELLENTLKGSVSVLADILALVKPEVYGRIARITPLVQQLSRELSDPTPWFTETAARLSMLGFIALPEKLVKRVLVGRILSPEEAHEFCKHPSMAATLLSRIPRLEEVARIVAFQEKLYDGSGVPEGKERGNEIPLGARILKAVLDYDSMVAGQMKRPAAMANLHRRVGWYDPQVLKALEQVLILAARIAVRSVSLAQLKEGMILEQSIYLNRGDKPLKVLGQGMEVNATHIEYLHRLRGYVQIEEPIKVRDPNAV